MFLLFDGCNFLSFIAILQLCQFVYHLTLLQFSYRDCLVRILDYRRVSYLSISQFLQFVVWRFLQRSNGSDVLATKQALFFIVLFQYVPRLLRVLPLTSELKRTAGVFAETAWAGAAYYLLLYMLASHVSGYLGLAAFRLISESNILLNFPFPWSFVCFSFPCDFFLFGHCLHPKETLE